MDIVIRNVPADTLEALRARAREHGRTIAAEALEILRVGVEPAGPSMLRWLRSVADSAIDPAAALAAIRAARDER
jgi:plasmid stability protein